MVALQPYGLAGKKNKQAAPPLPSHRLLCPALHLLAHRPPARLPQPQLFSGFLSALAGPQRPPAVVDAAVQALLLILGADTFSGNDEAAERAAAAATLSALASLRHRLGGHEGEALAVAVAQLGSALAERAPEWCGGELPQVGGGGTVCAAACVIIPKNCA